MEKRLGNKIDSDHVFYIKLEDLSIDPHIVNLIEEAV